MIIIKKKYICLYFLFFLTFLCRIFMMIRKIQYNTMFYYIKTLIFLKSDIENNGFWIEITVFLCWSKGFKLDKKHFFLFERIKIIIFLSNEFYFFIFFIKFRFYITNSFMDWSKYVIEILKLNICYKIFVCGLT